jgi:hypothetical protein
MPISLFVLPALIVIVLFVLARLLFRQLETHHPGKYEEMGSPSFHVGNDFRPIFATLKFICRREHRELGDSKLSNVSDAMLACFLVYIVLFAYVFFYTNAHNLWRKSGSAA